MSRILLIEPSEELGKILKNSFEDNGYKVDWARSAQDAVDSADDQSPAIAILEIAMPEHNGLEFLYEFRSYSEWMDIPIIIYSYIEPDRTESGLKLMSSLGVAEYLYKPTTTLDKLIQSTRKIIK